MELYLCVLAGAALYLLLQLNNVYNLPDFSWKTWFRTNSIPTAINILVGFILVWQKEAIAIMFPVTPISAILLGTSGQAVWKKLASVFDKKIDTVISL